MAGEPELRAGISSEWVQYLQQLLQHYGYWSGAADGSFGEDLESAVRALQEAYGLPATGVVDASTWSLLTGETNSSTAGDADADTASSPGGGSGHGQPHEANPMTPTGATGEEVPASFSDHGLPAFQYTFPDSPVAHAVVYTGEATVELELELTAEVMVTAPESLRGTTLVTDEDGIESLKLEASQTLNGVTEGLVVQDLASGSPSIGTTTGIGFAQFGTRLEWDGAMVFEGSCQIDFPWQGEHGEYHVQGSGGYALKVRVIPDEQPQEELEPVTEPSRWLERNAEPLVVAGTAVALVALLVFAPEVLVLAPAAL